MLPNVIFPESWVQLEAPVTSPEAKVRLPDNVLASVPAKVVEAAAIVVVPVVIERELLIVTSLRGFEPPIKVSSSITIPPPAVRERLFGESAVAAVSGDNYLFINNELCVSNKFKRIINYKILGCRSQYYFTTH